MNFHRIALITLLVAASVCAGQATAQANWECRRGDGGRCSAEDMASSAFRQILVMPTGYTEDDRGAFFVDVELLIADVSNAGTVWSTQKRDRILYIGYFVGGGPLATPDAAFGGAVLPHPIRDYALSANNSEVVAKVNSIRASEIPELRPMAVAILFNDSRSGSTDNASPPGFTGERYGIARMTRGDLSGSYVTTHELAHAALNFLDEYVEEGFENLDIRALDVATPLVLLDGSPRGYLRALSDRLGVYDYNLSEMLANNGNDNVATSPRPSTVSSPASEPASFPYEGGVFFGRGTFHAAGSNLMNSDHVMRADDDGFAFAHSESQQRLIETAFGAPAYRANDRLRNAGPKSGWSGAIGPTPTLLMFDADKNHHFHPTQHYTVQVGWYENVWATCWRGSVPYACVQTRWRVAQKTIDAEPRSIDLKASSLYGLANLVQSIVCGLGITDLPSPEEPEPRSCERFPGGADAASLPTFGFRIPYEETTVPASQWFTTYYWRFSTHNGRHTSGWTGWSDFHRSF